MASIHIDTLIEKVTSTYLYAHFLYPLNREGVSLNEMFTIAKDPAIQQFIFFLSTIETTRKEIEAQLDANAREVAQRTGKDIKAWGEDDLVPKFENALKEKLMTNQMLDVDKLQKNFNFTYEQVTTLFTTDLYFHYYDQLFTASGGSEAANHATRNIAIFQLIWNKLPAFDQNISHPDRSDSPSFLDDNNIVSSSIKSSAVAELTLRRKLILTMLHTLEEQINAFTLIKENEKKSLLFLCQTLRYEVQLNSSKSTDFYKKMQLDIADLSVALQIEAYKRITEQAREKLGTITKDSNETLVNNWNFYTELLVIIDNPVSYPQWKCGIGPMDTVNYTPLTTINNNEIINKFHARYDQEKTIHAQQKALRAKQATTPVFEWIDTIKSFFFSAIDAIREKTHIFSPKMKNTFFGNIDNILSAPASKTQIASPIPTAA